MKWLLSVTVLVWHRAVLPMLWLLSCQYSCNTWGRVSREMTPILSLFLYDIGQCSPWHDPSYLVAILVWHSTVFPIAWLLCCDYSCMTQGSVSHSMTHILSLFLYDIQQCFPWHDPFLVTILTWHRAVFPMAWLLSCHFSCLTQGSVHHGMASLGVSVGCVVRLGTRRSRVQPPPRSAIFFRGDWSWNIFYLHSLPSADSRRAVVSFWRKNVHNTG